MFVTDTDTALREDPPPWPLYIQRQPPRVQVFSAEGDYVRTIDARFNIPRDVAVEGGRMYVVDDSADPSGPSVQVFLCD